MQSAPSDRYFRAVLSLFYIHGDSDRDHGEKEAMQGDVSGYLCSFTMQIPPGPHNGQLSITVVGKHGNETRVVCERTSRPLAAAKCSQMFCTNFLCRDKQEPRG